MSRNLTLPDELFDRLRRAADQQGLAVEQLLGQWVGMSMPDANTLSANADDDLLVACTRALLDGTEPPIPVDWALLEGALQSSEPKYPTVEDAMSDLRKRPWAKDW